MPSLTVKCLENRNDICVPFSNRHRVCTTGADKGSEAGEKAKQTVAAMGNGAKGGETL